MTNAEPSAGRRRGRHGIHHLHLATPALAVHHHQATRMHRTIHRLPPSQPLPLAARASVVRHLAITRRALVDPGVGAPRRRGLPLRIPAAAGQASAVVRVTIEADVALEVGSTALTRFAAERLVDASVVVAYRALRQHDRSKKRCGQINRAFGKCAIAFILFN